MPRRQNPHYQRSNKMHRPAFRADLQRLDHALLPQKVCHPWAQPVLDDLSPAAMKVFSLMVSLAKCGRKGYPGLAEPDVYAASVVKEITGQKCGLSTWRNGRRELCDKGIVSRTYWTRPDQRIRNGDRVVVVPGGERVHQGGDRWCTKQIRVTLLTPAGAGLFDKSTRLEASQVLAQFPTPLKSNARSLIEDSHELPKKLVACPKATSKDKVRGQQLSTLPTAQESQGSTTCPSSSTDSSSSTGEHRPLTSDATHKHPQTESRQSPPEALIEASRFWRSALWTGERGCSADRPKIPRGAQSRRGRAYARIRLLNILHQCLSNYPTPEADEIWTRARVELELTDFSNWPSVANIPYWLSRAPKLTRRELFGYMRSRLIPAWKYSAPVVPSERRRYREWTEPGRKAAKIAVPMGQLPGFLQKFSNSVGLKQD